MDFPEDLQYTREHEWTRKENGSLVVGITDYAQESLGESYTHGPSQETHLGIGGDASCSSKNLKRHIFTVEANYLGE